MNVRQHDYTAQSGDTAAIRIVIHPQRRMPFPEDEGVNISPGFSTSIGIKQVDETKMEEVPLPCYHWNIYFVIAI